MTAPPTPPPSPAPGGPAAAVTALGRWAVPLAGLLLVGPVAASLIGALRTPDGGGETSLLVASNPVMGLAAGAVALALAGFVGAVGARCFGVRSGLNAAGLTLLWPALGTGRTGAIFELGGGAGSLVRFAFEGALVGAASVALTLALARVASDRAGSLVRDAAPNLRRSVTTQGGVTGTLFALAAALGLAWLAGQDDLRGQAVFAAFVAGIGAGAAARLGGTAMDPDAPPQSGFVAMGVAAAVAPAIGFVIPGVGGLTSGSLAGTLPGLLHLQPLDWAVGALLGVPTGLGWAGQFDHEKVPAPRVA